ncbi:MAG: hypothetical protein A2599_01930 [Candidatus Staskawiczbacteria bacterium RIFOXYD1_FULL_39_28]|nr:MAG: hypothetical protein A2599_01930 [Candidatus Staskawiczbacteria bacterium RIFOXYD1_FULL_39_28]
MSNGEIILVCVYLFASLGLIIIGNWPQKPCRHHKWPKRSDREYKKDSKTGQYVLVDHNDPKRAAMGHKQKVWTGDYVKTDKDEWGRSPYGSRLSRSCEVCGTTEMRMVNPDGREHINVYSNGELVKTRELTAGEDWSSMALKVTNITLVE